MFPVPSAHRKMWQESAQSDLIAAEIKNTKEGRGRVVGRWIRKNLGKVGP